jgi:hypothetical protein
VSRHPTTRVGARAAAPLVAVALLTGCSAGFNAQTSQAYSAADGVLGNSGDIRVADALVVVPGNGATGVLSMTLLNRGTRSDRLVAISSPSGTVQLAGDTTLTPGDPDTYTATSSPSAVMTNVIASPGQNITLTLKFARTAPLKITTVVEPATGVYATVTPAPVPSG